MREKRPDGRDSARDAGSAVAAAASLMIAVALLSAPISSARAEDYFKGKTIHIVEESESLMQN